MPDAPAKATPQLDTVRERPGGRSARIRKAVLEATLESLLNEGYASLSHRTVAKRAGVDPATVYRRWPTRPRLAVDALLDVAHATVPVPDTGDVAKDMRKFLDSVVAALADEKLVRLFRALSAAGSEAEGDLRSTVREFWDTRFADAGEIVTRAIDRGELPASADPHDVIEQLIAPAYFRALVSGEPFGRGFAKQCVEQALVSARS